MWKGREKDNFIIVPSKEKQDKNIEPYLSVALTKNCTMHCRYCGEGGELTKSAKSFHPLSELTEALLESVGLGVSKIRLTGGEPFTYPHMLPLLDFIKKKMKNIFILINTNGTMLEPYHLEYLSENIHVVVHLDTLNEGKFNFATNTKGFYSRTIKSIEMLSDYNRLFRLNTVLSTINKDEIFDIISFCRKHDCNLKMFDITSVPLQFGKLSSLYVPLLEVEKELEERADKIIYHEYAKCFGTPCRIYDVDGVRVTLKNKKYGSRYDMEGYCKKCEYFPCDEGVYDLLYYPDGTIWGCRWRRCMPNNLPFTEQLLFLAQAFQRADWYVSGKKVV